MKENRKYHFWDITHLVLFYSVLVCLVYSAIANIIDFTKGLTDVLTLIAPLILIFLTTVPTLIKALFKIKFSRASDLAYYLYMFFAGYLGVVLKFYQTYVNWHILTSILFGLIVALLSIFILNFTVYRKDKTRHHLPLTCIFMLFAAVSVGCVWELFKVLINIIGQFTIPNNNMVINLTFVLLGGILGIIAILIAHKIDKNVLKTFKITKVRKFTPEVEDIEE